MRGGRDKKQLCLEILKLLEKNGKALTEHVGEHPLSAQGKDWQSDDFTYTRDKGLLNESDVVIAEVSTPSLGVGYEIGKAEMKRPVLCLFREQDERNLLGMLIVMKIYN